MKKMAATLAESVLLTESTTTSRIKWWPEPRQQIRTKTVRTWDKVDKTTKATIKALACGNEPWPLFIHGPTGTGKTCAALAFMDWVQGGFFLPAEDLLSGLIDMQNGRPFKWHTTATGWWLDWSRAPVTCLDEIGARQRVTDFHYEAIKRAIDRREGEAAIFISNETPSRIAKLYDERVASRLASGTVLEMAGRDRRITS